MTMKPCIGCGAPVKVAYFAGFEPTCNECISSEEKRESMANMTEVEKALRVIFEKWFSEQENFDVFSGESRTMMFNTFVAGWEAREMFDHQIKVGVLHNKLRLALAESPKWAAIISDMSIEKLAKTPRIRVEDWDMEKCRAAWDWIQGAVPLPEFLAEEIARFKA